MSLGKVSVDVCFQVLKKHTHCFRHEIRHSVCLSDECVMAPMSLFHPELLDVTSSQRPQRLRTMDKNDGDPEDPHDDIFDTAAAPTVKKPLKVPCSVLR